MVASMSSNTACRPGSEHSNGSYQSFNTPGVSGLPHIHVGATPGRISNAYHASTNAFCDDPENNIQGLRRDPLKPTAKKKTQSQYPTCQTRPLTIPLMRATPS